MQQNPLEDGTAGNELTEGRLFTGKKSMTNGHTNRMVVIGEESRSGCARAAFTW